MNAQTEAQASVGGVEGVLGTPAAPTPPQQRIELLDGLRGFALLAIFSANIHQYRAEPTGVADRIAELAVEVLILGSFYPLFSMLFGVGFTIFLQRASARGALAVRLYLRRLGALAVIGGLQYVLIEPRHILIRYAVLGLPLFAFLNLSRRALIIWIFVFLTISAVHEPVLLRIDRLARGGQIAERVGQVPTVNLAADQQQRGELEATEHGRTYASIVANRLQRLERYLRRFLRQRTLPHIFAFFLLGVLTWRSGILQSPERHRRLLVACLVWGGVLGLLGNATELLVHARVGELPDRHPLRYLLLLRLASDPALTIAYVSAIALISINLRLHSLLAVLSPLGRMALTNYLLQSVVMSLLFLRYGLGLNRQLGFSACVGIAVLASSLQALLSSWWLRRFRFGPAEWLWRCVTYGRWQSMRRIERVGATAAL